MLFDAGWNGVPGRLALDIYMDAIVLIWLNVQSVDRNIHEGVFVDINAEPATALTTIEPRNIGVLMIPDVVLYFDMVRAFSNFEVRLRNESSGIESGARYFPARPAMAVNDIIDGALDLVFDLAAVTTSAEHL